MVDEVLASRQTTVTLRDLARHFACERDDTGYISSEELMGRVLRVVETHSKLTERLARLTAGRVE